MLINVGVFRFRQRDFLGEGAYSKVYKGENSTTLQLAAIHFYNKQRMYSNQTKQHNFKHQVFQRKKIKQKNFVKMLAYFQSKNIYYLIEEYCPKNLHDFIYERQQPLSEAEAIEVLIGLSKGLSELIKNGIVHRNLKPTSIFLKDNQVKIGDLGFAKSLDCFTFYMETIFQGLYLSPQMLKGDQYTYKCQIWAIGTMFYEMLHKKTPWKGVYASQLLSNIKSRPLQIRSDLSQAAKNFIVSCLVFDEQKRLGMEEYFKHDIFKGEFIHLEMEKMRLESKMKEMLTQMENKINIGELNIQKSFKELGHQSKLQRLNFWQFLKFMKNLYHGLNIKQVRYFFEKISENNMGCVCLEQMLTILKQTNNTQLIQIQNIPEIFNPYTSQNDYPQEQEQSKNSSTSNKFSQPLEKEQSFQNIEQKQFQNIEQKTRSLFTTISQYLIKKNISLKELFDLFNIKSKDRLIYIEFMKMIRQFDKNISHNQLQQILCFIDTGHTKTISFAQLQYYFKQNTFELEKEPIKIKEELKEFPPQKFDRSQNSDYQQHQKLVYQQPNNPEVCEFSASQLKDVILNPPKEQNNIDQREAYQQVNKQ